MSDVRDQLARAIALGRPVLLDLGAERIVGIVTEVDDRLEEVDSLDRAAILPPVVRVALAGEGGLVEAIDLRRVERVDIPSPKWRKR